MEPKTEGEVMLTFNMILSILVLTLAHYGATLGNIMFVAPVIIKTGHGMMSPS